MVRARQATPSTVQRQTSFFVPAPHALLEDRHVSVSAFRLWCVVHQCQFRHEPPAMQRLQDMLGSWVTEQGTERWRMATRRSIERWLRELETAGWLTWNRRAELHERYQLHSSPRAASSLSSESGDAGNCPPTNDAIYQSDHTIPPSHCATSGSGHAITLSPQATPPSYHSSAQGFPKQQTIPHRREKDQGDPSSQEEAGPTATERFLVRAGFSAKAALEFRHLALTIAQHDIERRRRYGQGPGAIINAWRIEPPRAVVPAIIAPEISTHYSAKQQALALAPADASELEVQYLALALEEGHSSTQALAQLHERRAILH